jgi:hypothetical protein
MGNACSFFISWVLEAKILDVALHLLPELLVAEPM